ncbi:MAG: phosphotransferase [Bacillota bacterium]
MSDRVVGRGRISEVLAWSDGQVLKLFHCEVGRAEAEREARAARMVHQAGAPCPAVGAVVEHLGRAGIVYQRVEGHTMLQRPLRLISAGGSLAELHARVHQLEVPGLPSQRERLQKQIERAPVVSSRTRAAALRALDRLPGGNRLCHGDFHPGNVMIAKDREVIIDWHDAAHGNPVADVARTCLLLQTAHWSFRGILKLAVWLSGQHLARHYRRRYLELVPGARAQLADWQLPVAVARLSEGVAGAGPGLVRLAEKLAQRTR